MALWLDAALLTASAPGLLLLQGRQQGWAGLQRLLCGLTCQVSTQPVVPAALLLCTQRPRSTLLLPTAYQSGLWLSLCCQQLCNHARLWCS